MFTVLVEEIYHAQSERDAAVMSRLRLANEERDEALLKTKRLEQAFEGYLRWIFISHSSDI